MRDETIMLRLTADEKKLIEAEAKLKHTPPAVWARQKLMGLVKENR